MRNTAVAEACRCKTFTLVRQPSPLKSIADLPVTRYADLAVWCGSIALLAGALAHVISCRHKAQPPASLEAWEGLATQACIQLLQVCTSHPNQKKVYTAVMTKHLLLLLSQAIWPPPHHLPKATPQSILGSRLTPLHALLTAASSSTMAFTSRPGFQLTAAAQNLLRAVLFHSSSYDGLTQLGASFSSSSSSSHAPENLAAANAVEASAPRSYHFQLLQVDCPCPLAILLPCPAGLPSVARSARCSLVTCYYGMPCTVCMTLLEISPGITTVCNDDA